jgi:hypothetical protein
MSSSYCNSSCFLDAVNACHYTLCGLHIGLRREPTTQLFFHGPQNAPDPHERPPNEEGAELTAAQPVLFKFIKTTQPMINVKGIVRRSHPNWLRTTNRNSRSTLARIFVAISPLNPNFLMKDRRIGLRSLSPRSSPLLVTIASTHTNATAANRSAKSNAECKRPPHKLTNHGFPERPKPALPAQKNKRNPTPNHTDFADHKNGPPHPAQACARKRESSIAWRGDSTKQILESNKHTARRPEPCHNAILPTNKESTPS